MPIGGTNEKTPYGSTVDTDVEIDVPGEDRNLFTREESTTTGDCQFFVCNLIFATFALLARIS